MATSVCSSLLPESLFENVPCCGGSPFKGMDLKLKYAVPRGISLSGFQLDVTLDATNPNSATLRTTGFTYKVAQKGEENGAVFAEGSLVDGIALPGGVTTEVIIPVNCTYGGVGSLGKSLLMGGKIDFVMSGETQYKIPMTDTPYTVPYKVEGSFAPTKPAEENASEESSK